MGNVYVEEFTGKIVPGKQFTWDKFPRKNIYPMRQDFLDFLYKGKVYLEQSGKRSKFNLKKFIWVKVKRSH